MTDFSTLGLSAPMLRALEHGGFKSATPIQAKATPLILQGRDVVGVAQTGSGKTAAFVIPLLEKLALYEGRAEPHLPRALILAPTRELAIQTTDRIKELSVGMRASCCTIYGGAPYRTQSHILRRGVDILISTPGRLLDHIKRGNLYLDAIDYFVLDEADRMLDLGFVDDVRRISAKITGAHQSVMFSATLNEAIKDLKSTLLNDPAHVEVAMSATVADNLAHGVLHVPGHQKKDLLAWLIEEEQPEKSIVFVRTRRDAEDIANYLTGLGLKANSIHGDKPQKLRQRTINGFRLDDFDFLVATDVAARGIDVSGVSHVFNFDVPVEAESYVHRIGRTARGGASGRAFTLCGKNEPRLLKAIETLLGESIEVIHDHPFRLITRKKPTLAAKKRPAVAARKTKAKAKSKKVKGRRAEFYGEAPKKSSSKQPAKNKGKPRRTGAGANSDQPDKNNSGKNKPSKNKSSKNKFGGSRPGQGRAGPSKSGPGKSSPSKSSPSKSSPSKSSPSKSSTGRKGRGKAGGGHQALKRR